MSSDKESVPFLSLTISEKCVKTTIELWCSTLVKPFTRLRGVMTSNRVDSELYTSTSERLSRTLIVKKAFQLGVIRLQVSTILKPFSLVSSKQAERKEPR